MPKKETFFSKKRKLWICFKEWGSLQGLNFLFSIGAKSLIKAVVANEDEKMH